MAQSAQGYTVSQIIVDALNRAAGCTPEMFTREGLDHQASLLANTIKDDLEAQMVAVKAELLREFAALLIEQLCQRNIITDHQQVIDPPSGDGGFVDSLISSLSGRIKRKEDTCSL